MLLSFLKKPYPYLGDLKKDVFQNVIIGSFIAFFLIVFEPFEINLWQTDHKVLKLAGFGLISFLIPCFSGFAVQALLPARLKEERWNIGMEMLLLVFVLLLIAAGNFMYGIFLNIMPYSSGAYLFALLSTLLVGIFPVSLHVLRKHNALLRINLEQSLRLNSELRQLADTPTEAGFSENYTEAHTLLVLKAENEKDELLVNAAELLFIESADNYATVVCMAEGKKKKELIRSSLKRIESQLNHEEIIRCHRAYIINLAKIKTIEGNAAGYRLYFHDTDDVVPVSRSYVQALNEKLKHRR